MESPGRTQAPVVGSQKWRLNNLYRIVDEQGQEVTFSMRPAQERFYDSYWYYNVVLKARQLGFTTLIDLIALDMVLFRANFTAVIIAETKEKAGDIFRKKILYPYEHLPQFIRDWCRLTSVSQTGEAYFSNGSCIKVMVSARSGTCQFLHVSEYGPVCAKQPGKAQEIKTGSFPAVHAGGYIFVESTAMGNSGHFFELVMQAQSRLLAKRTLGKQDYMLHFFPWHENAEYVADPTGVVIPDRMLRYFDDLYRGYGIELTEEQQAWYCAQEATYHENMWAEFPSYAEEAFKVAQDGSYYGKLFNDIHREQRICHVPYDRNLPVYTAWDLGMSDETSIWFFQFYGKEVRVIDFYSNNGEGLPHYVKVVQGKEYTYARHFAPHDIAVRELGSGISRMEAAARLGLQFERIPTNADLMGGIENVRELLPFCWFDEVKTESGRKALEAYKKEWDEKHACYKNYPLHDWSSHASDAFRTMAVSWALGLAGPVSAKVSRVTGTGGLRRI